MHAVDTNVLVRLIVRDEAKQTVAAEKFTAAGAWVPHIALVEMVWVLESYYGKSRNEIANALGYLLDHRTLVIQDSDVVADALNDFTENRGVEFADCLVRSVARKHGHTPVGTFDTKFARLDNATLI